MANIKSVGGGQTYHIQVGIDIINCDSSLGVIVLILPPVASAGIPYSLSINDISETSATNNIIVQLSNPSDRINGGSSFTIAQNGIAAVIQATGNSDFVLNGAIDGGSSGITGGGSTNYIPLWIGATALGNSYLSQNSNGVILASGKTFQSIDGLFASSLSFVTPSQNNSILFPNISGTLATINGGQTFTSAIWNGTSIGINYLDNSVVTLTGTQQLTNKTGNISQWNNDVGYVTAVSVTTANGISGISSGGTTPSLTLSLGAITPTSVNGTTSTEIGYLSGALSNIQAQINNINSGLSWKNAVRAATTANITLSGAQTIDGISVIVGDRVLVKNQSTAANNGIYLCASGVWTRTSDTSTGAMMLQATVSIEEGSVNADTIYTCITDAPITIGVTNINFAKTSATTYTSSNGITLSAGNNFTLDTTLIGLTSVTSTAFIGALTGNATTATNAATATNIAGGVGGSIPYQTAVNTTSLLANGLSGQVLTSAGTTLAPTWTTPTTGTVTAVSVATNQGISGASSGGATPALTLSLGALTGVTSVNGLIITANTATITTGVWNGTAISNTYLANSAVTIGTTSISLGATSLTLVGLTSVGATTFTGALTGNSSTATALQNARTINGVSFDGTQNITVPAAAGTLTGVVLPINGGTGISNNNASTLTISGNFATTITVTAATGVTLPTSGTLYGTLAGSITSAQMLASMSDPTGTGLSVFATSPTFTTSIITPLVQGGTLNNSQLDLRGSNNASVTSTAIAIEQWYGNSGTTSGVRLYQDGQVVFGVPSATTVKPPNALSLVRVGLGASIIDLGESVSGSAAMWLNPTTGTPSNGNYAIKSSASNAQTNVNAQTTVALSIANSVKLSMSTSKLTLTPAAVSTGAPITFEFSPANDTAQTAGADKNTLVFNTATIQHNSNTIVPLQRTYVYNALTYSFATSGGGVTTDSATMAISGSPISGTNAAPTNVHGLLIQGGTVSGAGTNPTNGYGLTVNATVGATNNYAAQFLGGNVGVRISAPTAYIHIAAGTSTANTAPIQITNGTRETVARGGLYEYENNHYKTNNSLVRYGLGGAIFDYYTDASNSTTVETDLYSTTTIASTLAVNGDKIEAYYGGLFVSSGTATRQIKIYFGGTAIFDTGALTLSLSSAWTVYVDIIRVSSTVIRYEVSLTTQGAALSAYTSVGELTGLTLSNANTLKITGQAAGVGAQSSDIIGKMGSVKILAAA